MIIETPFRMQMADDTNNASDTGGYGQFQNMSVAKWPSIKWPIQVVRSYTWTDGRFVLEIEDRVISEELHAL